MSLISYDDLETDLLRTLKVRYRATIKNGEVTVMTPSGAELSIERCESDNKYFIRVWVAEPSTSKYKQLWMIVTKSEYLTCSTFQKLYNGNHPDHICGIVWVQHRQWYERGVRLNG